MSVRCTDCHTGTMYYTYNDTDGLQDAIDVMCDLWNRRTNTGFKPKGKDPSKENCMFYGGNSQFYHWLGRLGE